MKFGKKSKGSAARPTRGGSAGGGARVTSQRPEIRNNATDSLPGMAGYPNGPRSELPAFFEMRRPDGRQERPAKPRGFFG